MSAAGKQKVYNITVEDDHEYFAENVLVSNCDAVRYLLGGLARTSAVYEAALQRKALDETQAYIHRGTRQVAAYSDPRYSEDDILEGEIIDESELTDEWIMQNGILLPGGGTNGNGNLGGNVYTGFSKSSGIAGLPLPF